MTSFTLSEEILDLTNNENPYFKGEIWRIIHVTMPDGKPVFSPPHFADTLEILLTQGIEGEIKIRHKAETFAYRSAYLIPPKTVHSMRYFEGGDFILCLQIDLKKLHQYVNLDKVLLEDSFSIHHCFYPCNDFDRLLNLVLSLSHENSFAKNLGILLDLFSCFSMPNPSDNKIGDTEINEIINYININFNKDLSLSSVASHFCYHKNYFCNFFKKKTGMSFMKYLYDLRIAHACYLLNSNHTVSETADLCGFSDPAYFTKIFRSIVGMTPTQYTKSIKPTTTTPPKKIK